MIWADAYVSGIPITQVNVPTEITISDGGIDAEVHGVQNDGKYGIIKKGITSYQIKSGRFDSIDSSIKDILFKKKSRDLKDRIKSCFDAQGTLVVVFTGWDNPDRSDDQIKTNLRKNWSLYQTGTRQQKLKSGAQIKSLDFWKIYRR